MLTAREGMRRRLPQRFARTGATTMRRGIRFEVRRIIRFKTRNPQRFRCMIQNIARSAILWQILWAWFGILSYRLYRNTCANSLRVVPTVFRSKPLFRSRNRAVRPSLRKASPVRICVRHWLSACLVSTCEVGIALRNSHPGFHQPYVPPCAVRLVNGPTKPDRLCPRGGRFTS